MHSVSNSLLAFNLPPLAACKGKTLELVKSLSKYKNRESRTACGYLYSSVYIDLKRIKVCIITPEGSVAEELYSRAEPKPATFQKRKMILEYSD